MCKMPHFGGVWSVAGETGNGLASCGESGVTPWLRYRAVSPASHFRIAAAGRWCCASGARGRTLGMGYAPATRNGAGDGKGD